MDQKKRDRHIATLIVLLFIVLGAAALRLFRLGAQSLWLDEAIQVNEARAIDYEGFLVVAQKDNVPPLSIWILWACIKFLGSSETAVRIFPALVGLLTPILVYHLGKHLVSTRVGIVGAGLVAVSPFAIWYSQDGRPYSLFLFLSALIMLLFWRAAVKRGSAADWMLLTVATILGVYTHQCTIFLSASCGVFLLASHGVRSSCFWKWMSTQVVAALVFVPWLVLLLDRIGYPTSVPKGAMVMWVPYTFFTFLFGLSLGPSVRELQVNTSLSAVVPEIEILLPLGLAAGGLMIVGITGLLRTKPKSAAFCLVCLGLPLASAIAVTQFTRITYNPRYLMPAFPAFVIILASAIVSSMKSRLGLTMTALVAIGMVWSTANWFFNPRYSKEDIRSAAAYLTAEVEDEDAIIISSSWVVVPLRHYGFAIPKDAVLVRRKNVTKVVSSIPQIEASTTGRIWLVESYAWASDPEGLLREALDTLRPLLFEKFWPGISLRCYAKVNEA